jgi:superfamily II DNA or RNA helicase
MQNAPPGAGQRASDSSELGSRKDIERASCSKAQPQTNWTAATARPVGVTLRPYQALDIVRMRQAYRGGASRICCVLPTGGGKTVAFSFIVASAAKRGKRVLILGHRQEIVDQVSDALTAMGVQHGLIAPKYPATIWPVQIASVATFARRLDPAALTPFDLIVVDEAHHARRRAGAPSYRHTWPRGSWASPPHRSGSTARASTTFSTL